MTGSTLSRRLLLRLAAGSCVLPALSTRAGPAAWHDRPLHVIVPYPPGGPSDALARAIGTRWQLRTGQPLLVDNRPGASGSIGADAARRANPDGHHLLLAPVDVLVNNTATFRALPYDPLRDFHPLVQLGPTPLVLAVPASLPVNEPAELAVWARGRRIGYGSWGEGSHGHLLCEALLVRRFGMDAVHAPYRGIAPMVQDLIGGQVSAAFAVAPAIAPHVQSGRLRALAITGRRRSSVLARVPTLAELGFADEVFQLHQWAALLVPAGTPVDTRAQLEQALKDILADTELRRTLLALGFEMQDVPGSAETRSTLLAELALVPPLIRALGVALQ